jgi:macrolide-specific efflux system membrane fusion protein
MRRLKLTRHRAELQIVRSRLDSKVAGMTADVHQAAVAAAEENINRRKIVAPFDGVVVDLLRQRGEWVDAGEPLLRMIRLDRVRVEGFFDARQYNPEEVSGRPVTVEIERARGQKVRLPGAVVFVSPLVQAGDKYRVRVEVENHQHEGHWLLGPGKSASMAIHIDQPRVQ